MPLEYYILHLMDSPQVGLCTIASCRSPPPSPTMPITTFYIETECAACHCNLKLRNRSEKKGQHTWYTQYLNGLLATTYPSIRALASQTKRSAKATTHHLSSLSTKYDHNDSAALIFFSPTMTPEDSKRLFERWSRRESMQRRGDRMWCRKRSHGIHSCV